MSEIIQSVSYTAGQAKGFQEKMSAHLGIHQLTITLKEGERLEGVLTEIGNDYISILAEDHESVIPIANILYYRYTT